MSVVREEIPIECAGRRAAEIALPCQMFANASALMRSVGCDQD
jgi:hypothetical protein